MMISVASKAEKETRTMDEQMIMGRVIQVLEDNNRLPETDLRFGRMMEDTL